VVRMMSDHAAPASLHHSITSSQPMPPAGR
jgi:hypothetical protein